MILEPVSGVGNHYQIEYTGEEVRTLVRRVSANGAQTHYANLLPGPEPIQFTEPLIATIWMAYSRAARQTFKQPGSATCPFSESGEVRRLRFEVNGFGGSQSQSSARVAFLDDGIDAITQRPRSSPFNLGFLQFVFEAGDIVRTNGFGVPWQARMVEYSPRPGAVSSNEVAVRRSCELATASVLFGAAAGLSLGLPPDVSVPVADARLGNFRKAIFYSFTNTWPSLGYLKSTPEYMQWRLDNRDLVQPSRNKSVRFIFIVTVSILALGAVFFVRKFGIVRHQPQITSKP